MKSCPNHNDSAYKLLKENLGKAGAYAVFIANGENLPTLEEAQQIVTLHREKVKKVSEFI